MTTSILLTPAAHMPRPKSVRAIHYWDQRVSASDKSTSTQLDDILSWFKLTQIGATATLANHPSSSDSVVPAAAIVTTATSISIDHSNHTKILEPLPIIPIQQPSTIESTSDTHSLTHILESFKSTHLTSSHAAFTTESKESMTTMEDVHVAPTTPPVSPSPLPKSHRRPETLSFLSGVSFGDSHRRYDEHITEIGLDEPEMERAHLIQMVRLSEPRLDEFKDEETYQTVYKQWYIQEGYLLSGQREPKSPVAPGVIQPTRTSRKILGIPEPEEFRRSLKVTIKLKCVETWSGRFVQHGIATETVEEDKKYDPMEIDESVHPIVEYESSKANQLASHEQMIDEESGAPKDETSLEVAPESLLPATAGFLPTSTPIPISTDQSNAIRPTIASSYASVVADVIGKVVDAAVTFAQRFTVSTAPPAMTTDSIMTDLSSSIPVNSTTDPSPTIIPTSCQAHTTSEPTCMEEETKSVTSEAEEMKSVATDTDAPSHLPSIATPKPTRRSHRAAASLANQRRRGLTSDYVAGTFLRPSHLVQMVQLLQGRPGEVNTLVEAKEDEEGTKVIPIKMKAAGSGESSVTDTLTPSTNDVSQQQPSSSKSMIDPTSSDAAMYDLSKLIPTDSPQLDSVPTSTNPSAFSAPPLSVSTKVDQTVTGPKVPISSSGLITINRHCRDCPQLFQVKSTSRRVLCDPCYHKIQQITKDHAPQQATLQSQLATSDLSIQQQAAEGIVKLQQTIFLESRSAAPSPSIQQKSPEPLSTSPTLTTDGRSSTEMLMADCDSFSATDSNSPLVPLAKVDELVTGTDSPTSNSPMSRVTDSPLNHVPSMLVTDSPTCREGQTQMTDSQGVTDVTPATHHEQRSDSNGITDQEMKVEDDEEEEEEEEDDDAGSINSSGSASTRNSPAPNSKPTRRKAIRRVCEHCRWSARARCDPTDAHCDLHTERGKRERQVSHKLNNFVVLLLKQPKPEHGKKLERPPLNQQRVKKTGVSPIRLRSTTTDMMFSIRTTPKGRGPYKKRLKSTESSDELYCICQTPYDKRRTYLACDGCDQWFHLTCVGLNEDDDVEAIEWICQACQHKKSAPFTRSRGSIKSSTISSSQPASSNSSPTFVASIPPSLQQSLAPIPMQMMSIFSKPATRSTVTSASSYAFPSFSFFGDAAVGIRDSLARSTQSLRGSKRKHQEVEDEQKEEKSEESAPDSPSNEDDEEDDDKTSAEEASTKTEDQPMEEVTSSTASPCTTRDSSSLTTVSLDELATNESQSESKDHAKSIVKSIKDRHNKSRIKCRFEGCYHFNEPRRATVHEKDCPFQELDVIKRTEDLKLNYHFCDTCQLYWSNSNELGRSGSFQTHQRSCSPSNPSAESQLSATKVDADVTPTNSSADEPKKKKMRMTAEIGSQQANEHGHTTMEMKTSSPAASTRSKEKATTTYEIRT